MNSRFKILYFFLLVTTFLPMGFAEKNKTVETILNCEQQEDADQWYEVGIALNKGEVDGGGLLSYVVFHNDDDHSAKLQAFGKVQSEIVWVGGPKSNDYLRRFSDTPFSEFKLDVKRDPKGGYVGWFSIDFSAIKNGPSSIGRKKMDCFYSSPGNPRTITFDDF